MICIVGAGLTGLALARELARRGVEHVVVEAADRPGGVIRSAALDGRVLDFGPQRFRMSTPLAALVAELGLDGELLRAPAGLPLFVYTKGALREVPLSLRALAAGDLLSWRGKLRVALEPLTAGPRKEEPVATLLTRKLGTEAYERLAGPLYGGLFGSDPAHMTVGIAMADLLRDLGIRRSLLARFARRGAGSPAPACSFRGGMQVLADALHAAAGRSVRLGYAALGITRAGSAWRVETGAGKLEAEAVVLACAAAPAGRLLAGVAPDAARRLASLVYNPLAVVHLHAEGTALRGAGYQVAFGERMATRGVTWNASLFGSEETRRGVFTAFLGGAWSPEVVAYPDERLGEVAAREFAGATGRSARILSVSRTAMPAWDVSWNAMTGLELPAGIHAAASWSGRPGIPGRLHQAARLAEDLARRAGAGE